MQMFSGTYAKMDVRLKQIVAESGGWHGQKSLSRDVPFARRFAGFQPNRRTLIR